MDPIHDIHFIQDLLYYAGSRFRLIIIAIQKPQKGVIKQQEWMLKCLRQEIVSNLFEFPYGILLKSLHQAFCSHGPRLCYCYRTSYRYPKVNKIVSRKAFFRQYRPPFLSPGCRYINGTRSSLWGDNLWYPQLVGQKNCKTNLLWFKNVILTIFRSQIHRTFSD